MNLSKNTRLVQLTTARSAAFTTKFSKSIDMSGFEGAMFIVQGSTLLLANTTTYVRVQGRNTTAASWVNYPGNANSTQGAGVNYRNYIVDLYKPTNRYARVRITGSSSAAGVVNSILALQYGGRHVGSTHLYDSTTLAAHAVIIGATS